MCALEMHISLLNITVFHKPDSCSGSTDVI